MGTVREIGIKAIRTGFHLGRQTYVHKSMFSVFHCRAFAIKSLSMDQISLVPQHPPPLPVAFSGDRGEFFHLVLRAAGLEMITRGFYRFWLATDIRRHRGPHTVFAGAAPQ